ARRLVAAGGEQLLIPDIDSEGDEIGRLAVALTAMQRALGERLLSSAHAQLLLEQQVSARTVELQRRNEELRGALANLQKTQDALLHTEHLASIGRLVAGIAHEINNPINAVVNMAAPLREALSELAAPGHPGEATAETLRELPDMLRVIERGTRRTSEIVRALHSYADREPKAFAPADVHQILAEALELVQHPAKPGVAITREFAELPLIFAHAGQLQQVFINLLSNAFHAVGARAASAPADYRPRLALQTARDGERVQVTVRDNGAGIPPEVRLRIFDPFFTTKDASSGSGLGLSIVHGIVSRHGGTIAVDAGSDQGACFTVSLPVAGPTPGPR
ncbi:MAG TPA: ATP-binding protein, partial [Pseudomonadota bacterium]|nr:ATP-binding protein [Pseudomonadota bacterium]